MFSAAKLSAISLPTPGVLEAIVQSQILHRMPIIKQMQVVVY